MVLSEEDTCKLYNKALQQSVIKILEFPCIKIAVFMLKLRSRTYFVSLIKD